MRLADLPVSARVLLLVLCATAGPGAAWSPDTATPTPAAKLAQAGNYTVNWATHDGGGGRSTGGSYTLSGSIAQPDAEPLQPATGATYQLDTGFWGGAASNGPEDKLFSDSFE